MRVAGVQVGKISKVKLEDGIAVVTTGARAEVQEPRSRRTPPRCCAQDRPEGHVHRARPGHGQAAARGRARSRSRTRRRTSTPTSSSSALDTDTRDYLQLLINGAGKGLKGHGNDLHQTFKPLGPPHRDLARVRPRRSPRRRKKLAPPDPQLRPAHQHARPTRTARSSAWSRLERGVRGVRVRGQNISAAGLEAARRAAPDRDDARRRSTTFGRRLRPALESLRPPFRQLDEANQRGAAARARGRADRPRTRSARSSRDGAARHRRPGSAGARPGQGRARPDRPRSTSSTASSTSAPTTRAAPRR